MTRQLLISLLVLLSFSVNGTLKVNFEFVWHKKKSPFSIWRIIYFAHVNRHH